MDNKRGLIGKIVLIVVAVIILGLVVAGVYLYNFHVFKTVRICVGEGQDMLYPCETAQDCFEATGNTDIIASLDGAPDFIKETFQDMLDEAVYCDGTCFVRDIRGIDTETQELEMLESCDGGETEIVLDIRGKEGLEIYKWMKGQETRI